MCLYTRDHWPHTFIRLNKGLPFILLDSDTGGAINFKQPYRTKLFKIRITHKFILSI